MNDPSKPADMPWGCLIPMVVASAIVVYFLTRPSPSAKQEAPTFASHPVEASSLYPHVELSAIADGKWGRPRAKVTGIVKEVHKESDGDWHVRLEDSGKFIVCEIVPELPIKSLPKPGERVTVYGIVREDKHHGWWELHPVTKWELAE